MRTSAYLKKVAEKYALLQTKQQSHNGDCGVAKDIHSSNAVLSDSVATSHMWFSYRCIVYNMCFNCKMHTDFERLSVRKIM